MSNWDSFSPWCHSDTQGNPRPLRNPKVYYSVHKSILLCPILNLFISHHGLIFCFFTIAILPSAPMYFNYSLSFRLSYSKFIFLFHFFHACYVFVSFSLPGGLCPINLLSPYSLPKLGWILVKINTTYSFLRYTVILQDQERVQCLKGIKFSLSSCYYSKSHVQWHTTFGNILFRVFKLLLK